MTLDMYIHTHSKYREKAFTDNHVEFFKKDSLVRACVSVLAGFVST